MSIPLTVMGMVLRPTVDVQLVLYRPDDDGTNVLLLALRLMRAVSGLCRWYDLLSLVDKPRGRSE